MPEKSRSDLIHLQANENAKPALICILAAAILLILYFTIPYGSGGSSQKKALKGFDSTARVPEFSEGAKLFRENCAICHTLNKNSDGPALYGAEFRIPG